MSATVPRPIMGPAWDLIEEAARAWPRAIVTPRQIMDVAERAYGITLTERQARAIRAAAKELRR